MSSTSILIAAAVAAAALLVLALAYAQRRKHLGNERVLTDRRQVALLVEELLAAFAAVPLRHIDAVVTSGLKRASEITGASDLWIWQPSAGEDRSWMSLSLHSGESVVLTPDQAQATSQLPPPARARASEKGYEPAAVVKTPLKIGDELLGVLFWVSTSGPAPPGIVPDLRVIGQTFAQVLQRRRTDGAIEQSERLKDTILSSLVSSIAVLDRDGVIIEVNEAWKRIARANGVRDLSSVLAGANYRDVCEWAAREGLSDAVAALAVIDRACRGEKVDSEIEYKLDVADGERWFAMRASPLMRDEGGAVVIHREITPQKRAERVLHTVSGRLIAAQEGERRRIARELHDDVGQRIALLAIEIDQAAAEARDGAGDRIRALGERTAEIAVEIHRLSHALHSSKLDALGLAAAVRGHCREMSATGLQVRFFEQDVPSEVPSDIALCLFRVVQEALNNVARHSGVQFAQVELSSDGEMLEATIVDEGCGFELSGASEDGGIGLVGMRERLTAIRGTLVLESRPGAGTTVRARVPLQLTAPNSFEERTGIE